MSLPPLKDVIARFELSAKKSFGQHFLLDHHITDRIAQSARNLSEYNIIEIGPGPGGLTRSLLAAGAKAVYAIEKDTRCIAALEELKSVYPQLHIIEADALEVNLPKLVPGPRKIVANLPYNVGTAMLVNWLEDVHADPKAYASLTLMFQKEVAGRISAERDTSDYGRLAVLAQWLCRCQPLFDLPPGAFVPPPKVTSTVIQLTPHAKPLFDVPKPALEKTLAAAFGQRRKMLRQAVKPLGGEALLAKAAIDGTRRAETLTIEEFCRLATAALQPNT